MLFPEDALADDFLRAGVVALGQESQGTSDAQRRFEQALSLGVLANELQLAPDQLLEFLIVLCIRHSCFQSPTGLGGCVYQASPEEQVFSRTRRCCSAM